MNQYSARLAALAKLWNRVEKRVKEVEHFRGEALVPAINEMRYAGRRLADALTLMVAEVPQADDPAQIDEHLIIAKSYLINADHDVTDSICFVVIRQVDGVIRQHGRDEIAKHYPDFWNVYPAVLESQKIIQGSREERQKRAVEYEKLADDYIPKLTALYDVLVRTKELALADSSEKLNALSQRVDLVTVITIGGFVVAALALLFSVFGWIWSWSAVYNWFH